jgi:hypothetical protein
MQEKGLAHWSPQPHSNMKVFQPSFKFSKYEVDLLMLKFYIPYIIYHKLKK